MDGYPISLFISRFLYYPIVIILLFNLLQRRFEEKSRGKRMATLLLSVIFLLLWGVSHLVVRFQWPDAVWLGSAGALIIVAVLNRKRIFPFRIFCRQCGDRLALRHILFLDDDLCEHCAPQKD